MKIISAKSRSLQRLSLYTMAFLYVLAGSYHFIKPSFYQAFMPPWVPYPGLMIGISGFFEIAFALLLLPKSSRTLAAWGIIALLIAVFPANIQLSINYYHQQHPSFWLTVLRLPLQLIFIWWAGSFTGKKQRAL